MSDLKSRIQKASEFSDKRVHKMLNECLKNRSGFSHEQEQGIKIGSQWQHSQMQWLVEALDIAVEFINGQPCHFMPDEYGKSQWDHNTRCYRCMILNKISVLVPKGEK